MKKQNGFTLPEIVLTLAIASLAITLIGSFYIFLSKKQKMADIDEAFQTFEIQKRLEFTGNARLPKLLSLTQDDKLIACLNPATVCTEDCSALSEWRPIVWGDIPVLLYKGEGELANKTLNAGGAFELPTWSACKASNAPAPGNIAQNPPLYPAECKARASADWHGITGNSLEFRINLSYEDPSNRKSRVLRFFLPLPLPSTGDCQNSRKTFACPTSKGYFTKISLQDGSSKCGNPSLSGRER